ncbi:transposase family protein [Micromonospora sp. NPDC002717]|uniref:transposase family protein n=1 Tax=Micromonospora sp. NPDC002717 TaxID=3154424 RepID=UPI00332850C9
MPDPRGVRYPFTSVLAIAVCAVMTTAATFAAIADWIDDLDAQRRDIAESHPTCQPPPTPS